MRFIATAIILFITFWALSLGGANHSPSPMQPSETAHELPSRLSQRLGPL